MGKPYVAPIDSQTVWICAGCDKRLPSLAAWRAHNAVWDGATPITPACPAITMYVPPDPAQRSTSDQYAVLVRENTLAGMSPRKAGREAAIAVGYRDPAPPMPEDVKTMLRERNASEAEIKRNIKRRQQAKSRRR